MAAKKSMKDAATAGTSVFDQIARGSTKDIINVNNVENVNNTNNVINDNNVNNVTETQNTNDIKNVPAAKSGRPAKYEGELVRINLKIPAEYKDYLTIAAAKASIEQRRSISLTQYICDLIDADREKYKDD